MKRTHHEMPLDWEHWGDDDGRLMAVVDRADGEQDEYIVKRETEERMIPRPGAPLGWWYWCAGDDGDLDDNVCGWVPTKQEAIRYCERVARWRKERAAA